MIRVEREAAKKPATLRGSTAKKAQERAARFFNSRSKAAHQSEYEFDRDFLESPAILRSLSNVFDDRCAFCGRGIETVNQLVVHHFRPPQGAVASDGKSSRRHYWWLAYDWSNLYLACTECQAAQGQKFPVGGDRARVGSGTEALANERPLLLDPCAEDPESVLVYLDSGEVVSADSHGRTTIETFELNRPQLTRDRAVALEELNWDLGNLTAAFREERHDTFLELLYALYDPHAPLAGLRRQRVNQWAQVRPRKIESVFLFADRSPAEFEQLAAGLRRITNEVKEREAWAFYGEAAEALLRPDRFAIEGMREYAAPRRMPSGHELPRAKAKVSPPRPWTYLDSAEIRAFEIRNFRAIEHLTVEMTTGPGEGAWLMLLGENGTGKSSVLQALALALSDTETIDAHGGEAEHLLRKGSTEGLIRVELTGRQRFRELRFGEGIRGFRSRHPMEGILVAGYGATRLLPRRKSNPPSESKVEGLFDPFVPLTSPSSWLPKLDDEEFNAVARALKRLLNLADDETMRMDGGDIYLDTGKHLLRLADLSDGYQSMAGFGLDLMELFLRRWGTLEAAEGVVLVDELGAHLHPRWQMKITGLLRAAFPRVQFVATTHDPLCLHGLHDGEVVLLRSSSKGVYALRRELPPIDGLAVDQILTSEHFGLHSTRDPKTEERLNRYYSLLGSHRRDPDEAAELGELQEQLDSYSFFGATRRERLALEAADDFIAAQPAIGGAEEYAKLHSETAQRIREIWEKRLR